MVYEYKVFGGKPLVSQNTYVKKGDVLIDGNDSEAKGFILATVFEEKTIVVPKTVKETQKSGNKSSYNQIVIFGKGFNMNKNTEYEASELLSETLFTIPFFVKFLKDLKELEYSQKEALM